MTRFAVVEFNHDKAVAVICTSWFIGDEEEFCQWPNEAASKISRLVKAEQAPCSSWKKYKIRVLGKAGNYERALQKLKLSEVTSDLNTDIDEPPTKRRRIPNPRFMESDSSDEEESNYGRSPPVEVSEDLPLPPPSLVGQEPLEDGDVVGELASVLSPSTSSVTPRRRPASLDTDTPGERTFTVGERLLRRILEVLLNVQATQNMHSGMMQKLIKQGNGCSTEAAVLPDNIKLPADSVGDIDEIDRVLRDQGAKGGLVNVLSEIGGRNVEECVKRVMKFVVTTKLSTQLNMSGRNQKKAFGPTHLFDAVYRGIKRNTETSECSRKDVEKSVSKWLIGGRDRDGNRARRTANPGQQQN